MSKLNIMIVDDSLLFRKFLSDGVEQTGVATVQSMAEDGMKCLKKLETSVPDVVLLDINMPGMNGLEVLNKIKEKYAKVQVIIISSAQNKDKALTMKALEMGALDFIAKPKGGDLEKNMWSITSYLKVLFNHIIINKLYNNAKRKEVQEVKQPKIKRQISNIKKAEAAVTTDTIKIKSTTDLVLIASSTGGPKALYDLCSKFPKNFKVPILIVQHMPTEFTAVFANSLNNISKLMVSEAKDGDMPKAGHIYIAKGGVHMTVEKDQKQNMVIKLKDSPAVNGVKPAADVLFKSVADNFPNINVMAAVLTGMGKDGTDGLRKLKQRTNCYTISQSEKTCAVYGMPKSVYEANLSDEVLDLQDIAQGIVRRVMDNN